MLDAKAFANAAATVTAVFYIACVALVYLMPDLLFGMGKSWMHSINLESVKATTVPDIATSVWGLITMAVFTWITTYALITLYNRWAR